MVKNEGGRQSDVRGPVKLSQLTGSPTFRATAINSVAVVPLLCNDRTGIDDHTFSGKSFYDFLSSLHYHSETIRNRNNEAVTEIRFDEHSVRNNEPIVVVIPNSNLTRPGDWKYNETPLKNFHWGHGCQRLRFFDGRPYHSRLAHDRLINHELTRNWIDLYPSRRTAALIGILNVRDCPNQETLDLAIQEWNQWALLYSTPPYEATAHGRDVGRDVVVPRLFIFDSFHETFVTSHVDLSKATDTLKKYLVAFPPTDDNRSQIMELHVAVVLNDLAVAVFQQLEEKIRESNFLVEDSSSLKTEAESVARTVFFGRTSGSGNNNNKNTDEECPRGFDDISIENLVAVVGPNSKLTPTRTSGSQIYENFSNEKNVPKSLNKSTLSAVKAKLLTPLDNIWDCTELSPKDAYDMMKREVARREKFAADLSLLAGSPLDAYERYTKAAHLFKKISPDPLWYANALEGCASAHICMADIGGFNVDEYLDSSFHLHEDMACALVTSSGGKNSSSHSGNDKNKRNMPQIVMALCEDALDVTSRHPKLACFHAELLLKMAWYTADIENVHLRCQWGLGDAACFGGDPNSEKRRWEMASATRLNLIDLSNKHGEGVVKLNTYNRCKRCIELLHKAASTTGLDPVSRADVCLRCVSICWKGLRATLNPTHKRKNPDRIRFRRKAFFFAVAAGEAMSDVHGEAHLKKSIDLWVQASYMLFRKADAAGAYGWACLRTVILHAWVLQGTDEATEKAALDLLILLSTVTLPIRNATSGCLNENDKKTAGSARSDSYLESIADARSYLRESAKMVLAKDARQRSKELFRQQNEISSLMAVQSKWVDDDPLTPSLIPFGVFSSDFSHRVLALRAVWSTTKLKNCSMAQKQVLHLIAKLRKRIPVSTVESFVTTQRPQKIPIDIKSVSIVRSESSSKLERVETRKKVKQSDHSMATFFNPYANKKITKEIITIPRGEEQYFGLVFMNTLGIPFHVTSCELKFATKFSDRIKAPSIYFVIPALSRNFMVHFPFIILDKLNDDDSKEEDIDVLEISGVHMTALSRSIFFPLREEKSENDALRKSPIIPNPASLYPRRNYNKTSKIADQINDTIVSPSLEIVPPQPKLSVSFVSSTIPIDDERNIPVMLSDGETFVLPKICVSNDTGLQGLGKIEEFQLMATGLPELGKVKLYSISTNVTKGEEQKIGTDATIPIMISAVCDGMDLETLNSIDHPLKSSTISVKLSAVPCMGSSCKQCSLILRFRYRGRSVSTDLQVWRSHQVDFRIFRVKGPRISSMSFRCDLSWESGYADIATMLDRSYLFYDLNDIVREHTPILDESRSISNRLGNELGIHVCGDKVAVLLSVTNEAATSIMLRKQDGLSFGFPDHEIDELKIAPGVSTKVPIMIDRISKTSDTLNAFISRTRLQWLSDIPFFKTYDVQKTCDPIYSVNRQLREGTLEVSPICLKHIMNGNSLFFLRLCEAPCAITLNTSSQLSNVDIGTALECSVEIEMTKWVKDELLGDNKCALSFCCTRRGSSSGRHDHESFERSKDFVWIGQVRTAYSKEFSNRSHKCNIIFVNKGDYYVSAFMSFCQKGTDNNKQELWLAEKALKVHVNG